MTLSLRIALWAGLSILVPTLAALAALAVLGRPLPWQFALPAVSLHVAAGLMALALGAAQLLLSKRAKRHRLMGYAWCSLLAFLAVSGLAVDLDPGGATVIHRISSLFSVATLALLPIVVHAGRTGQKRMHRNALLAVFSLLLLAGGLTFFPHRAIGGLFVGLSGQAAQEP
jgi:uncharacterized membrane protein